MNDHDLGVMLGGDEYLRAASCALQVLRTASCARRDFVEGSERTHGPASRGMMLFETQHKKEVLNCLRTSLV